MRTLCLQTRNKIEVGNTLVLSNAKFVFLETKLYMTHVLISGGWVGRLKLTKRSHQKKNGKNFTLFLKLILAKKRTFLTSFRVKNNGLTNTLSLGSKETKLLCLLADIQVSYHYLG